MSKPNKKHDIGTLVELARKGDTQAFGLIYDELVKPVYRYIYYRVDPEIAEDLTEETFLRAWQHLKDYKPGRSPFSAWVFRIAHNLVCDYYRKHEVVEMIDETAPDPALDRHPVAQVEVKLNQIRLRKAIRELPETYQQVIILKYINELENDEVAATLNKTEGAVRTIQFRALKQLRTILEGQENEEV